MATITKFEDIEIWQLARLQANDIYNLYNKEPFNKDFELRNQINAASGSVMDNIAEGFDRSGNKEFSNFSCFPQFKPAPPRLLSVMPVNIEFLF